MKYVVLIGQSLVALAATISLIISVGIVRSESVRNCRNIEKIKNIQRSPLTTYQRNLGRKGTVGYSYYKDHPDELLAAKSQITSQLTQLRPSKC